MFFQNLLCVKPFFLPNFISAFGGAFGEKLGEYISDLQQLLVRDILGIEAQQFQLQVAERLLYGQIRHDKV